MNHFSNTDVLNDPTEGSYYSLTSCDPGTFFSFKSQQIYSQQLKDQAEIEQIESFERNNIFEAPHISNSEYHKPMLYNQESNKSSNHNDLRLKNRYESINIRGKNKRNLNYLNSLFKIVLVYSNCTLSQFVHLSKIQLTIRKPELFISSVDINFKCQKIECEMAKV